MRSVFYDSGFPFLLNPSLTVQQGYSLQNSDRLCVPKAL